MQEEFQCKKKGRLLKPEYNLGQFVKIHFGILAEHVGRVNQNKYRGVKRIIIHEKYDPKGNYNSFSFQATSYMFFIVLFQIKI